MRRTLPATVILLGALAAPALPQGLVHDGDTTFEWVNYGDLFDPPSPLVAGLSDFHSLDTNDVEHLRQHWFYFRVAGAGAESAFPPPHTEVYESDPGRYELGWSTGSELPFDARLEGHLTDAGSNQARLVETLTITNPGAAPLEVVIFTYADVNSHQAFGNQPDTAELVAANRIRIDDHGTFDFAEFLAVGADAWKVQGFNNLLQFDLLNGSPSSFSDTGLPFGPGNFTGAFQWDLELAAHASHTIGVGMSVNTPASATAPELILSTPAPGVAGTTNRIDLGAGTPGAAIALLYGLDPGILTLPICGGLDLGFTDVGIGAVAANDPTGNAGWTFPVGPGSAGLTILLQAVEPSSCRSSPTVAFTFQ